VENFNPREHAKEHPLEPFVENIRILRKGGASYKTVKMMLGQVGVEVCVTTVARFCQGRLLNPPKKKPQKKRSKKTVIDTPKNTTANTSSSPQEEVQTTADVAKEEPSEKMVRDTGKRRRGPRIADPKNI